MDTLDQLPRFEQVPSIANSWINTFSGEKLSLLNPDPECIHIYDIANGLSMTCRYSGQIERFYSVAEHSYWVSVFAETDDPRVSLAALLHDAAEAYIGDVTTPLKALLPDYQEIEERLERAIFKKYGILDLLKEGKPTPVAVADARMLVTEVKQLVPYKNPEWSFGDVQPYDWREVRMGIASTSARRRFIARFDELRKLIAMEKTLAR